MIFHQDRLDSVREICKNIFLQLHKFWCVLITELQGILLSYLRGGIIRVCGNINLHVSVVSEDRRLRKLNKDYCSKNLLYSLVYMVLFHI